MRRSAVVLATLLLACGDDATSTETDAGHRADATGTDAEGTRTDAGAGDAGAVDASRDASRDAGTCGDGRCALDEDATSCCADCGVCDEGAVVRMETGVAGGAPGAGITPGGMADTHAYFAGGSFSEVVFPFTVTDEPVDGTSYYWAQQFFFEGTTQGGYTGVQTGGILGGAVVGKMVIFSIWDAIEATPGPAARCEPFGGEGVGQSCRLAFEWRENVTYTFVLREVAPDQWSMTVLDPAVPTEILLGTIRVPEAWGRVRPPTAGFAEYFGTTASCDTLPHAVALLHQPLGDGAAPTAVEAAVYGPCAARASSVCMGVLCR